MKYNEKSIRFLYILSYLFCILLIYYINNSPLFFIILMCAICSLEAHHYLYYTNKQKFNLVKPKGRWNYD